MTISKKVIKKVIKIVKTIKQMNMNLINCSHIYKTNVGEGVEIAIEKYYYLFECNNCKTKIKEYLN
jgi:hypothetical protein